MTAKHKVIFIADDGATHTVEIAEGWSLMEGAIKARVPGIDADCGGACACATCQVYVEDAFVDRLPPKSDLEESMLDFAPQRRAASRLSCQVKMTAALDGMVLRIPATQR